MLGFHRISYIGKQTLLWGSFFLSYKNKAQYSLFMKNCTLIGQHIIYWIFWKALKEYGRTGFLPFKFMTELILDKFKMIWGIWSRVIRFLELRTGERYLWIHLPRGKNLSSDTCPIAGSYYAVSAHEVYSSRLQADISPKTWKTLGPTDV